MTAIEFNARYPIGTAVQYWPGSRRDPPHFGRTRSDAHAIYGVDCVRVEGCSGPVALTHVLPIEGHDWGEVRPTANDERTKVAG